ncbi:YciI family protein [Desulfoluna butyratoxydans]|uniref:Dimeric alpha-beta barrel n=1 Tax=Desulfoluna butyratoxydans TaxID=231438 RepID=A0A4U8YIH0_9BACT|nr:YciI family protein [Desulfoluna butyratoxydans]VFQ43150.1 dimeric alpha-beta barrel [Desulfoluna butyratoxydans]
MYIVSLTYVCEMDKVDANLEAHVVYLKEQYEKGCFIASGRKVPRTGGVILADMPSRDALDAVLAEDPFCKEGVARYDVTEFVPSMAAKGFECLLPN